MAYARKRNESFALLPQLTTARQPGHLCRVKRRVWGSLCLKKPSLSSVCLCEYPPPFLFWVSRPYWMFRYPGWYRGHQPTRIRIWGLHTLAYIPPQLYWFAFHAAETTLTTHHINIHPNYIYIIILKVLL